MPHHVLDYVHAISQVSYPELLPYFTNLETIDIYNKLALIEYISFLSFLSADVALPWIMLFAVSNAVGKR